MWRRCTCLVLLMLMLGSAAYGAAFDPLKDAALIAWWKCDEGKGSLVSDSGPGKHDGTFINGAPAWVQGVNGSAIRLAGPTLVEVPAINQTLTAATMCGWFLPSGTQADWASMIMHRGGGLAHGFNFLASRQLAYHWADAANTWSYRGTAYYAADEWTHCGVTVEPDKATFYVNGNAICVNAVTHPAANWNNVIHLGGDDVTAWPGRQMNGSLDDVMFFSRALTAAEMKSLVPPKLKAMKPNPADKATNITMALLQWTAGETAMFHDVYLGTSPDLKAADRVATHQPFAMYYHVAGFKAGTTYYWRVDEIDAAGTVTIGDVWSFSVTPATAWAPVPASGAGFVKTSATLTWSAGQGAMNHDVYVSANKDDVVKGAAGAFKGNQKTASVQVDNLTPNTVYYWRVDEVGMTGTKLTGDIWTFSTRPVFPKTDPTLVGWWKLDDEGSGTAVDYSGYDRDGTLMGKPQWVDGYLGGALAFNGTTDYVETNYVEDLAKWTISCWVTSPAAPGSTSPTGPVHREKNYQMDWNHGTAAFRGAAALRVGGTWYSAGFGSLSGNTWYHLTASYDGKALKAYVNGALITTTPAPGTPDAETGTLKFGRHSTAAQFFAGTVDDVRVYNRDLTLDEIKKAMQGDPLLASNPQPAPGSNVDIANATSLTWTAGDKAAKHDVYFGKDAAAVKAATAGSAEYKGRQTGTSFSLAGLVELGGGTYVWRIDEVEADGTTIHKGSVWTFTVPAYLIVDEFESYTDKTGEEVFTAWVDGYATGQNGSTVGNNTAVNGTFGETTIVHNGKQSMPMDFDNSKSPFYSEATREFSPLLNWTGNGVTDLSLWVRGYPALASVAVTEAAGKISLTGDGTDIWNNSDQFTFAYKTLNGDGSIAARVVSNGTGSNTWAKGGVMIRDSLDGGSTFVNTVLTGSAGNGATFQYRLVANAGCGNTDSTGVIAPPYWVKVERVGDNITGYLSTDGKTWRILGITQTIAMTTPVYIGLCVTSHAAGEQRTFQFDSITTTGGVTGAWQGAAITDPRSNSTQPMYLVVEDSTGKTATATNATAANQGQWTQWKVPLSSLTGVNLAKVKKLTIGVGDKKAPAADGSGRVYIDDIQVVKP